ncbi:MAG: hypothetical protein LBK63_00520, partial [Treponema sp.]|nr:hypothetical protein [Treponema sp.]
VRQLTVNAVADTGVINLVIDEETREKLGLRVEETVEVALAGDIKVPGGMTEYVELRWKDRHFFCAAWNLRFPFSPAKKALPWANTPCSA